MSNEPQATLDRLNLTTSAVFVPLSQSRNKDQKHKTLNWRVTVRRNDKEVLTTDYSQGIGHIPNWQKLERYEKTIDGAAHVKAAIEEGLYNPSGMGYGRIGAKKIPAPKTADILYSLTLDASVLDHPTFESWAGDFGMDPDSRKGEATYRACLELALKLRAAVGDEGLQELQTAFQDY